MESAEVRKVSRDRSDPIFVIGNSRSGTTLMAKMLSKHPDIYFLHETHFMEEFSRYVSDNESFQRLGSEELIELINRALTIQRKGYQRRSETETFGSEAKSIRDLYETACRTSEPTVFLLMDCIFHHEAAGHGAVIPGDQTPRNIFHVLALRRAYSEAKFVHMIRDPRAVTLSQKNKWKAAHENRQPVSEVVRVWFNYHPISIALLWKRVIQEGARLKSILPEHVMMSLRFEDLCEDAEKIMRCVCDFIEVGFTEQMLSAEGGVSSNLGRMGGGGINRKVVDIWRERLGRTETFLVEVVASREMRECGYSPTECSPNWVALFGYMLFFPIHVVVSLGLNLGRMGNPLTYLSRRFLPRGS